MLIAGCGHLGQRLERARLPEGAPAPESILADLAASNAALQDFRGSGTFLLESPDLTGRKKFQGTVKFRRPASLYVEGNHRITRIPIFRLIAVEKEFLMEFPGSADDNFYELQGGQFRDVPFSVSPADVVREMFFPEDWSALGRREVHLTVYETATDNATMVIGTRREPRRILDVARVNPDQPRWVVTRNVRVTEDGQVLAETGLSDYHEADGVLFPQTVDVWFPTEQTRMTFRLRGIRTNTDFDDDVFDIRARARELGLTPATAMSATGK